jgi:hypothetical protein
VTPSAEALLADLVDYAGLFPPAGQSMTEAVHCYARYRRSADAWMLGRFIVPASRLDELDAAGSSLARAERGDTPWRISAIIGAQVAGDVETGPRSG